MMFTEVKCWLIFLILTLKIQWLSAAFLNDENNLRDFHQSLRKKSLGSSSCQCNGYDCGCCVHLKVSEISLDDTGCANVTYLPSQVGISVTFSLNGKVYIKETVSAKNPPPLCFGVPDLSEFASLCILLDNLSVSSGHFGGCIALEARFFYILVEKISLGCFYAKKLWLKRGIRPVKMRQVGALSKLALYGSEKQTRRVNRVV